MRFILPERTLFLAKIARLLGENVTGLDDLAATERAITAVDTIREQIGVPGRIRDLGGHREQLPTFAAKSFAIKRLMATTPRTTSEVALLEILEGAF